MNKQLSEEEFHQIVAEEDLVIDIQFLIQELMETKSINRAMLSEKMGISKARLTQLMKPDANPTVRSLARVFLALGEELKVSTRSKGLLASHKVTSEWTFSEPANDQKAEQVSVVKRNFVAPTDIRLLWPDALKGSASALSSDKPDTSYSEYEAA